MIKSLSCNSAISSEKIKHHQVQLRAKSIRPFIGARNFQQSRSFYRDLGFEETILSESMSVFKTDGLAFYLQHAYVKELSLLDLSSKYEGVKLLPVREYPWGRECFLHDPSGVLWHFGEFN
jgi:hypothetical protein